MMKFFAFCLYMQLDTNHEKFMKVSSPQLIIDTYKMLIETKTHILQEHCKWCYFCVHLI